MKNSKTVIAVLVLIAVIAAVAITQKSPRKSIQPAALSVRTVTLSGDLPIVNMRLSGTTQSAETTALRFQVGGRVVEKYVRLGDSIAKGDVLAKLYNPELEPLTFAARENLARLAAETEQAKRDFARIDALYKDKAVTQAEWEGVRTGLSAKKNAQAAAQSELARATQVAGELDLLAPFNGTVTEIMIDVGDVVASGAPAVRISNPKLVELKLAVSDLIVNQIKLGQEVPVYHALQTAKPAIQGMVSEISPYREQGSLPEIIISLNAEQVRPGVAVNANIAITALEGISVPTQAVLMTGVDAVAVYKVVNGVANLVPIRPLRLDSEQVVIEQGLSQGDSLVVEGISKLYDGAQVKEASTPAGVNSVKGIPFEGSADTDEDQKISEQESSTAAKQESE